MQRIHKFLTLMIVISLTVFGSRALAEEWYVDDDLQDCPDADFTKIQEAVDAANPGDIIIVCPGEYTENVYVNKSSITIMSKNEAPEETIVLANDPSEPVFEVENSKEVNLSWVTIKGAISSAGIKIREFVGQAGPCTVENNIISNNNLGIDITASDNHIIAGNTISDNNNHVIGIVTNNNIITDNIISNNGRDGINTSGTGNTISKNNISSNL